ncbi:uncharacterized protein PsGEF isoform X1 [Euwallacea fornicatus]|uniref:uncharacterized protein PsGEF isoform X1 n=1 Tax=Euwallacea fornicatus TaxID=995702 RepID=UPI00338EFA38
MLKWTVLSRRDPQDIKENRLSANFQSAESLPNTPRQKTKRRRSSASRNRKRYSLDALEADKENQFHSTPVKNSSLHEALSHFRDLSNLTPPTRDQKLKIKKKKECLENHEKLVRVSDGSNYFTPFEAVDSHIESFMAEQVCSCKKPSKIFSFNEEKITQPKSIEDVIGATNKDSLPGLRPLQEEIRVSPLVRKFLDLKFSKSNAEAEINEDSSFINEMSLDKLVEALLERSSSSVVANTSMIVNVTSEKDALIHDKERLIDINSEASSDSGFKSSTNENLHRIDSGFLCKCNNNNIPKMLKQEKTIIEVNESYRERCVDVDDSRKRPSTTPEEVDSNKKPKTDFTHTLKRQRCVRRKKLENFRKKLSTINTSYIESQTVSPFWSNQKQFHFPSDEDTFPTPSAGFEVENTPLRGCYLENKDILGSHVDDCNRTTRKCLIFDSPKVDTSSSFADSTGRSAIVDVRGSVDLRIFCNSAGIYVNVIRCHDLCKADGEVVNPYVKVAIYDRLTSSRSKKKNAVLQRTAVQSNSSRPIFNHTFKLPKLPADTRKRLHIEIWHRERTTMSSEFLGCMSFDAQDVCKKIIEGRYRLLPQSEGRSGNIALTDDLVESDLHVTGHQVIEMGDTNQEGCCSESVVEEVLSFDGFDNDLKRSTNKAILNEQQKYADEHLFLRYLELDPIEGPEAIPAALQRKATGNKFGRTPFTQTKRLSKPAKSGFGFSVVWTHPPRIERVEKGLPAERAGILPGDYIIFVDKHNVVMMPEIDILNLIRSYGSQLTLEIFRRNPSRNGSVPSVHQKSTTIVTPTSFRTDSNVNLPSSTSAVTTVRRPSTVCSTNTASVDFRRRKLNLPQVTFSSEKPSTNPEEGRKRAMYQLITKEQQYATALQFATTRFVSALAERRDLITPSEHKLLFQNSEELLRITEDILDHLVHEDGEMDTALLARVYQCKLLDIKSAYKRYCAGIKKADCVLANKMKNSNSDFVRFVQCPTVPRRRPDLTSFIHKPLEHYREILKFLITIQGQTSPKHEDFSVIGHVVHEMQITYREITSEGGLMEPCGEGRPLLSMQDLESRLVFTKCKPFSLNKPGRQWIFGGDLGRVEGRNVRQYWTLLFSDLILFAKASRDRVLFITEEPIPLAHITDMFFNVRKKDTEFRISINSEANRQASSPTIHCGPDLTRTPRKNSNKKTVILRAPTTELKAVWQNLLQRQIFQLNSGLDGSALSSPMESPDVPIHSSVGTLQSIETSSFRRQPQTLASSRDNSEPLSDFREVKKQLETLIEHKCKQMGKSSFNGKCNAIHLEQWMKGQLDNANESPMVEQVDEVWSEDKLRKRSEELQLVDAIGNICSRVPKKNESMCEEITLSDQEDQSPSKSTTNESQVTVRSSPIVPEAVPVCRQCHKNCISNILVNKQLHKEDCNGNAASHIEDSASSDWRGIVLIGVCGNPVADLMNYDPFKAPEISVAPPTPENSVNSGEGEKNVVCNCRRNSKNVDISPDESPETEEHPYHSLNSSIQTLRRYGTVSSLERCGSEDRIKIYENHYDDSSEESDTDLGIDNEAFNNSSLMSWTARAGSFVAEKMAFFEKIGEDYRKGAGFLDRYLKPTDDHVNGEEALEEETSGGTSGEEVWGTPTSGDLDDNPHSPNSPNFEGKLSPSNDSYSSDTFDDTELMMDELLMAPPITGAILRGLLPRRTLEPLIEEDFSETSSSSPSSDPTSPPSGSSGQDIRNGSAADTYLADVAGIEQNDLTHLLANQNCLSEEEDVGQVMMTQNHPLRNQLEGVLKDCEDAEECYVEANDSQIVPPSPSMPRSESYRKIVEAAEDALLADNSTRSKVEDPDLLFRHFQPSVKFANIERIQRTKSIRIFEFFNVRRSERRIYDRFPENQIESFSSSAESSSSDCNAIPKGLKDNRNGRFWRQLSRRRSPVKTTNPA